MALPGPSSGGLLTKMPRPDAPGMGTQVTPRKAGGKEDYTAVVELPAPTPPPSFSAHADVPAAVCWARGG